MAAANGHLAVVRLLLARGADPVTVAATGGTALTWAVEGGHVEVVTTLLQAMGVLRTSCTRTLYAASRP